jgi:hypothetical protein
MRGADEVTQAKRWLIETICLVSLVLCFGHMVGAAESASGPRIAVDELTHSFGKIKGGPDVDYSLKIYNKGDQPLEIRKVNSD